MNWLVQHESEGYTLRFAAARGEGDVEDRPGSVPTMNEERLLDQLCRAMPTLKLRQYLDYKWSQLRDSSYLVVAFARTSGEAVAMFAMDWYEAADPAFMHLGTMLIGEQHQGTTLLTEMLSFMFTMVERERGGLPPLLAMKTYNARAYSFAQMFTRLSHLGFEIHPSIHGTAGNERLSEVAARVAAVLSPGLEFDRETSVIKGGAGDVPEDFWPSFPGARDERINEYFQRHMTPRDRLLCVISLPSSEVWHAVMKLWQSRP